MTLGNTQIGLVSILLGFCLGCHEVADFQSRLHGSSDNADSAHEKDQSGHLDSGELGSAANEPVMTGGAFLNCQSNNSSEENADQTEISCRMEYSGEKIKLEGHYNVDIYVSPNDADTFWPDVESHPDPSPWHWSFMIDLNFMNGAAGLVIRIEDVSRQIWYEYWHDMDFRDNWISDENGVLVLTAFREFRNAPGPGGGPGGGIGPGNGQTTEPSDPNGTNEPARGRNRDTWQDGRRSYPAPTLFRIPERITVTRGNAGNHGSIISFDDISCQYRGGANVASPIGSGNADEIRLGASYEFLACQNYRPGDWIEASNIVLHIEGGDPQDRVEVRVEVPTLAETEAEDNNRGGIRIRATASSN